ncbi:MAG: hypothetical protein JRI35_09520, partial [Deltaproteobacteria bacterium]|nr:hypothetical protein [Deltaproteobacteria bacterium]
VSIDKIGLDGPDSKDLQFEVLATLPGGLKAMSVLKMGFQRYFYSVWHNFSNNKM